MKQINSQDLLTATPHHTAIIFKPYSRAKIAKMFGISVGYLNNIMQGNLTPSPGIEATISALTVDIVDSEKVASQTLSHR